VITRTIKKMNFFLLLNSLHPFDKLRAGLTLSPMRLCPNMGKNRLFEKGGGGRVEKV
jgi:hypothetical protein